MILIFPLQLLYCLSSDTQFTEQTVAFDPNGKAPSEEKRRAHPAMYDYTGVWNAIHQQLLRLSAAQFQETLDFWNRIVFNHVIAHSTTSASSAYSIHPYGKLDMEGLTAAEIPIVATAPSSPIVSATEALFRRLQAEHEADRAAEQASLEASRVAASETRRRELVRTLASSSFRSSPDLAPVPPTGNLSGTSIRSSISRRSTSIPAPIDDAPVDDFPADTAPPDDDDMAEGVAGLNLQDAAVAEQSRKGRKPSGTKAGAKAATKATTKAGKAKARADALAGEEKRVTRSRRVALE